MLRSTASNERGSRPSRWLRCLGDAVGEGFVDPGRTFFLYDVVRSAAVHGEVVPDVDWDLVDKFAWDVRTALSQYLAYASAHNFTKQSQLVAALDAHPDRLRLAEWLRTNGGGAWTEYLDQVEDSGAETSQPKHDAVVSQSEDAEESAEPEPDA